MCNTAAGSAGQSTCAKMPLVLAKREVKDSKGKVHAYFVKVVKQDKRAEEFNGGIHGRSEFRASNGFALKSVGLPEGDYCTASSSGLYANHIYVRGDGKSCDDMEMLLSPWQVGRIEVAVKEYNAKHGKPCADVGNDDSGFVQFC